MINFFCRVAHVDLGVWALLCLAISIAKGRGRAGDKEEGKEEEEKHEKKEHFCFLSLFKDFSPWLTIYPMALTTDKSGSYPSSPEVAASWELTVH